MFRPFPKAHELSQPSSSQSSPAPAPRTETISPLSDIYSPAPSPPASPHPTSSPVSSLISPPRNTIFKPFASPVDRPIQPPPIVPLPQALAPPSATSCTSVSSSSASAPSSAISPALSPAPPPPQTPPQPTPLEISIAAAKLRVPGAASTTKPVAVVYAVRPDGRAVEIGRTEALELSNPTTLARWAKPVQIEADYRAQILVEVFAGLGGKEVFVGGARFLVEEMDGRGVRRELVRPAEPSKKPAGQVVLRGERVAPTAAGAHVEFSFRASELRPKKLSSSSNRSSNDQYFEIQRVVGTSKTSDGEGGWCTIYRSEVRSRKDASGFVNFESAVMTCQRLNRGDKSKILRFISYRLRPGHPEDEIVSVWETSQAEMEVAMQHHRPLIAQQVVRDSDESGMELSLCQSSRLVSTLGCPRFDFEFRRVVVTPTSGYRSSGLLRTISFNMTAPSEQTQSFRDSYTIRDIPSARTSTTSKGEYGQTCKLPGSRKKRGVRSFLNL